MDILLISRCPPFPVYHGDRLIPHYLVRELSSRRHLIDLLAFYQQPEDLADVPRYEQMFRSVTLIPEPPRSTWSYLNRQNTPRRRFPTRASESWSPEMWHAIEMALETVRYDVVQLFGGVHVYEYLHLVESLPNLIVPYESYSLWMERAVQEANGPFERMAKQMQLRMARNFESWMFEPYERTVVLTDHDADALRALNPHTATITIPNGVDADYFQGTGHEPGEPNLMFIGNYDYAPNLDAALRLVRDLFPRIKQSVPKARLFLVGGNPPPELHACANEDIIVTGRVPDLRPYFEMALIFLSPLRLGAGIKNKVLEAMAAETPVVATPLSCDGIPVENGQHVLLGQSDEELVRAVFQLMRTPQLRQQLRRNGRALIKRYFTWERVADRYEELYEQVIGEHRARGGERF